MGRTKIRILWLVLFVPLVIGLIGVGVSCAQAPTVVRIAYGSMGSTGTGYPYQVALPKMLAKHSPNIEVTLTATGGGMESWQGLKEGKYHMGVGSMSAQYQIFNGQPPFKDVASKDVRGLLIDFPSPYTFIARADSGVKTIYDLAGKKVAFAQKGTDQELSSLALFEILGIKIDYVPATSYTSGIDAFKKGDIVAWERAAPPPHSSLVEIAVTTPMVVLGLTEADVKKFLAVHPEFSSMTIPAGMYSGQNTDILTIGTWAGTMTTKDAMTEDTAYQIVKAWHLGYDEFIRPLATWTQGVKDPLQALIDAHVSPLHAGAIKYLREKGKTVPAKLIPPEVK